MSIDWGGTWKASQGRYRKAKQVAGWCWEQGLTEAQVDLLTDDEWTRLCRLAVGKPASDRTRRLAQAKLLDREEWAAGWPESAPARRILSDDEVRVLLAPRRKRK